MRMDLHEIIIMLHDEQGSLLLQKLEQQSRMMSMSYHHLAYPHVKTDYSCKVAATFVIRALVLFNIHNFWHLDLITKLAMLDDVLPTGLLTLSKL